MLINKDNEPFTLMRCTDCGALYAFEKEAHGPHTICQCKRTIYGEPILARINSTYEEVQHC